jgi:predicted secreted protein
MRRCPLHCWLILSPAPAAAAAAAAAAARRFFEKNRSAQKNPLQVLVEKHKLKIKVDEKIEQAYSNGWRGHSAWYINGDGKPAMAKKNYAYKGGERARPPLAALSWAYLCVSDTVPCA